MPKPKRKFRSTPKKASKPAGSPVRELVECSPHRVTGGLFLSSLMEFDAQYESTNERRALNTILLCHDVRNVKSQGSKEPYQYEGRDRHHIPDFTVDAHVDGLRLEIKALGNLLGSDTTLEKYLAVAKGYRDRGIPFAFLVDAQLAVEPRASSVSLLNRYLLSRVPEDRAGRALLALQDGPLTVQELLTRASVELVDVWSMIAQRQICFDWSKPLERDTTRVSLPGQPFGGLSLGSIIGSTRYGGLLAEMALGRRPADKSLMADAAAWRQPDLPFNPSGFVGGFKRAEPLRTLTEKESLLRGTGVRRDFAPGFGHGGTRQSD